MSLGDGNIGVLLGWMMDECRDGCPTFEILLSLEGRASVYQDPGSSAAVAPLVSNTSQQMPMAVSAQQCSRWQSEGRLKRWSSSDTLW